MSEAELMDAIRLVYSAGDTRLFRNNVGVLQDIRGNYVRYGLSPGASDLIGWRTVNGVAVFTALEVKAANGQLTKAQRAFIAAVQQAGGFAGVVRTLDDAEKILRIDS